ncbi:MAG: dolichol-P-glucose synthetase homolog, partial [uncultured Friedmanniella sp.]
EPDGLGVGPPAGRSRHPGGSGGATGHRTVPARAAHHQRRVARSRCRPHPGHHRVLGLALADRRPGPRGEPAAGSRHRGVLPLTVPQHRAARWDPRRRPPRGQPRTSRRGRRAWSARRRLGAFCRAGPAGGDRAAGAGHPALARASFRPGGAGRGAGPRDRRRRRDPGAAAGRTVPAGTGPARRVRRRPPRPARPPVLAQRAGRVRGGHRRPHRHLLCRGPHRRRPSPDPGDAAAGDPGHAGDGHPDQHRWLGSPRGRRGVVVRPGRPRCRAGRRSRHRLRRDGAGRDPARSGGARRGLGIRPSSGRDRPCTDAGNGGRRQRRRRGADDQPVPRRRRQLWL